MKQLTFETSSLIFNDAEQCSKSWGQVHYTCILTCESNDHELKSRANNPESAQTKSNAKTREQLRKEQKAMIADALTQQSRE